MSHLQQQQQQHSNNDTIPTTSPEQQELPPQPHLDPRIQNLTKRINSQLQETSHQLAKSFQDTMASFHQGATLPLYHQHLRRHTQHLSRQMDRLYMLEMPMMGESVRERATLVGRIKPQRGPLVHEAREQCALARVLNRRVDALVSSKRDTDADASVSAAADSESNK